MFEHPRSPELKLFEVTDVVETPIPVEPGTDLFYLQTVLAWAHSYLSRPNTQLGRSGPVCPYVPTSLQDGLFYLAIRRGSDLQRSQIEQLLSRYRNWFLELPPTTGSRSIFKTILCLFPDLEKEQWRGLIEDTQESLKASYVAQGLMIGEFHAGPPEKAGLRNPDFRPLACPVPMLVIRHMVPSDYVFLADSRELMQQYLAKFQFEIPFHLRSGVRETATRHHLSFPELAHLERVHPTVRAALTNSRVEFIVHRHQDQPIPIRSPQDLSASLRIEISRICKSLFLRHTSFGPVILVTPVLHKVDMKRVARELGPGRLELASTEELTALLGHSPGGVSPLGADLPVVVDESLLDHPTVLIAAGEPAVEIELRPQDLVSLSKARVLPLGKPPSLTQALTLNQTAG